MKLKKKKESGAKLCKRASIREVAKQAGVSVSTVSYALNRSALLRSETRDKVLKAVAELGYVPNAKARAMRGDSNDSIGLVVPARMPHIDPSFFGEMLAALLQTTAEEKLTLLVEAILEFGSNQEQLPLIVAEQRVGGIILFGNIPRNFVCSLKAQGMPMSMLAQMPPEGVDIPYVLPDREEGFLMTVRHLAALRHTRIGLIHGSLSLKSSMQKKKGYLDAVSQLGLETENELIFEASVEEHNFKGGYAGTCKLLSLPRPPTAILYENDWFGVGGLKAASDLNVKVPDELSMIVWSGSTISQETVPNLTTVGVPHVAMARAAVDMVMRQIHKRPILENPVLLHPILQPNASCAPVNASGEIRTGVGRHKIAV